MNEAKLPVGDGGIRKETPEERQVRLHDEAEQYGLEPTHSGDVVVGAEIGGVGGAVAGAIAGSALGVPGAITGAVIGGVLGAAGSAAAVAAVDKIDDDSFPEEADLDDDRIDFGRPESDWQEPHPGDRSPNVALDPDKRPKDGVPHPNPYDAEAAVPRRRVE